jgi:hypothetical protein
MAQRKIHWFNEGSIETERLFDGSYIAVDGENSTDPTYPVGAGRDEWDAILSLVNQMRERGMLIDAQDEPIDRVVAEWDHARDLGGA